MKAVAVVVDHMDSNLLSYLDNSMVACLDSMGKLVVVAAVM